MHPHPPHPRFVYLVEMARQMLIKLLGYQYQTLIKYSLI